MNRTVSLLATAAATIATPALAGERAAPIDVPATRLEQAIEILDWLKGLGAGLSLDEFGAEKADMGHRAAERSAAQAEEGEQDLRG